MTRRTTSIAISLIALVVLVTGYVVFWQWRETEKINTTISAVSPQLQAVEGEQIENSEDLVPAEVNPISLPALFEKQFNGSQLAIARVLEQHDLYTRHYITYTSGDLTISGIMNVPKGEGPFPALILNHGHIDTSVYTNGRGLRREQDYFAKNGYVVLHPDYRNHAQSSKDERDTLAVRLGYVEDVINAVYALRDAKLPYVDNERIGMLGHSMGGGVTLSVLAAQPDLVDAAVLYAPVSGDMRKSYERWIARESNNTTQIAELYGSPEDTPSFWDAISAETYYTRITAPIDIFHGTADDSVPLDWSRDTLAKLLSARASAELTIYEGAPHEFSKDWNNFMESSKNFFDSVLKK